MYNDYQPGNRVRVIQKGDFCYNLEATIKTEPDNNGVMFIRVDGEDSEAMFHTSELEVIERLNVDEEWIDNHFDNLTEDYIDEDYSKLNSNEE